MGHILGVDLANIELLKTFDLVGKIFCVLFIILFIKCNVIKMALNSSRNSNELLIEQDS